jgi:hypothetical protein
MSFWGKVMNIEILLEKWFSKKMSLKRIEKYLSNRVKISNNNVDSNLNSTSNSHNNYYTFAAYVIALLHT